LTSHAYRAIALPGRQIMRRRATGVARRAIANVAYSLIGRSPCD
jgi:hypothetical protein